MGIFVLTINLSPIAPLCLAHSRMEKQRSRVFRGEDALATLAAFRAMGVNIVGPDNGHVIVNVGMNGLKAPKE